MSDHVRRPGCAGAGFRLLPDPASMEGTEAEKHLAFADAYRMLSNAISIFISLPMRSLDRLALQNRLDEIGRELLKAG